MSTTNENAKFWVLNKGKAKRSAQVFTQSCDCPCVMVYIKWSDKLTLIHTHTFSSSAQGYTEDDLASAQRLANKINMHGSICIDHWDRFHPSKNRDEALSPAGYMYWFEEEAA